MRADYHNNSRRLGIGGGSSLQLSSISPAWANFHLHNCSRGARKVSLMSGNGGFITKHRDGANSYQKCRLLSAKRPNHYTCELAPFAPQMTTVNLTWIYGGQIWMLIKTLPGNGKGRDVYYYSVELIVSLLLVSLRLLCQVRTSLYF